MKSDLIRIALIGPESSGKTTLCSDLAKHYQTIWVPEFARDYIASLNRQYTKEDILYCAEKQLELEEHLKSKANKILFSDTELIVCKVWLLDLYGECPEWIEKKIDEQEYDLYLLTSPDLPFVQDPVRENPHRRQYFYDWYLLELEKRDFRYEVVEGIEEERLKQAIEKIALRF